MVKKDIFEKHERTKKLFVENIRKMNESSSSDSLELSNEIVASYSLLFDKDKQNFSTSSEISFLKHNFSPIDHNQTVTKEISPTTRINNLPIEESIKFNPFLLLFTQDDEQLTVRLYREFLANSSDD
jgi:hypothetical protein